MLSFLLSGQLLLRLEARKFTGLLFQEPPRITRLDPFYATALITKKQGPSEFKRICE